MGFKVKSSLIKQAALLAVSAMFASAFAATNSWTVANTSSPYTDYPTGTNGTTTEERIAIGTTAAQKTATQLYVLSQKNNVIPFVVNTASGPTVDIAQFQANGTTAFVIKNSGATGIGTSTIGSMLQVSGSTALGYSAPTAGPPGGLTVSGAVGIGIATVTSTFQVNGNAVIGYTTMQQAPRYGLLVNGPVTIGTVTPKSQLTVNGTITAKEVVVTAANWSDYVFNKDYKLKPLNEVEKYVTANKHLEGISAEKQILSKGIPVGEMQAKLLQHIEELYIYAIEQNKKLDLQSKKIDMLTKANDDLTGKINGLIKNNHAN